MFGLGKLFYVNAIAVLSEDRFLKRIGLGQDSSPSFQVQDSSSTKSRIINLIRSIQTVLRIPLIVINIFVIIYELILG